MLIFAKIRKRMIKTVLHCVRKAFIRVFQWGRNMPLGALEQTFFIIIYPDWFVSHNILLNLSTIIND